MRYRYVLWRKKKDYKAHSVFPIIAQTGNLGDLHLNPRLEEKRAEEILSRSASLIAIRFYYSPVAVLNQNQRTSFQSHEHDRALKPSPA